MSNSLVTDGWTAVPRDTSILFSNQPYIHEPTALDASAISFPSEPLVKRIHDYAQARLPAATFNHSMRVFYWGMAILQQQFPEHDLSPSTYALSCLLHDIGTTAENLASTRLSFEWQGGLIALELLAPAPAETSQGGGNPVPSQNEPVASQNNKLDAKSQAEAVAEAIIRHQDLGTSGQITLLGQILQLATIYDNVTPNSQLIHRSTLESVSRLYPRYKWCSCFAAAVRKECEVKPWAHTSALGEEFPASVLKNDTMREFE